MSDRVDLPFYGTRWSCDPEDGAEKFWIEEEGRDPDEFDEGSFLSPGDDPEDERDDDGEESPDWEDNPFDGPANQDY